MKFANLISKTIRTRNYGEDIQNHAVKLLYDRMGIDYADVVRITMQELFTYDGDEFLVVPINGPFWGEYNRISPKIIPVYLGVEILDNSVIDSMRFEQFSPIGCRSQGTYELLTDRGIPAYINGCLTLTLPRRDMSKKYEKVFIVDVCDELYERIPSEIKKDAIYKTHVFYHRNVTEEESLAAYDEYRNTARLVITSRLHCAAPCVAFGIPVIYASKVFSKRSVWLSNIIPVYSEKDFDKINWNPDAPNVEDLKEILAQNAMEQIRSAWDKNYKMCVLSEKFESKRASEAVRDDMWYPIEYMKKNWDMNCEIPYIIWGITQTSETLYKYICQNFPKMKLVGVIDLYRDMEFHGVKARQLDAIDEHSDAFVFVAAEAANQMAKEYFAQIEKENFVCCWENPNYIIRGKSLS